MKNVSVIICAFNEENTIKNVIASISKQSVVNEIIVVNDGSTDKTNEIIIDVSNDFDFMYIVIPENKGKGFAMATGIENASYDVVVFIDADLSNLKEEHFHYLIEPIIENKADMVLGQANNTLINYSINPFKSFTGERSLLKKDILPIVSKMKYSRFGVETLINLYYQSEGKRVKCVILNELKHPTKFEKTTTQQAIKEFVKEGHQIAKTAFSNFDLITSSIKKSINRHLN